MPDAQKWISDIATLLEKAWPDEKPVSAASSSIPGGAAALIVLAFHRIYPKSAIVAIAAGPDEIESLFTDIRTFQRFIANNGQSDNKAEIEAAANVEPLVLYAPEPGDDIERDGMRLAVSRKLFSTSAECFHILITTATALLSPLPDPEEVANKGHQLKIGDDAVSFDALVNSLIAAGYTREGEVVAKGQIAVRGGLIDIWPPTTPLPVRIDFFGDSIDTIREFEPSTQRSTEKLSEVWLSPCEVAELTSATPVSKLPAESIFIWLEHDRIAAMTRRPKDDVPSLDAYIELLSEVDKLKPFRQIFFGDPMPPTLPHITLNALAAPGLSGLDDAASQDMRAYERKRLFGALEARAEKGENVNIILDTAGGVEWLQRELPTDTRIGMAVGVLSSGCEWPDAKLIILGQSDIYTVRKRSGHRLIPPSIANHGGRIERSEELRPGDLVVHIEHGIGRFEGTNEVSFNGKKQEVMTIAYADDAKLYVPVSHAHLLSRYIGVAGRQVQLHKLGGKRWIQDCIKAEKSIVDYAAKLLEVQAKRAARPGTAYDVTPPWMDAFEAAFQFKETPDQLKCIAAVKSDLSAPRPMDRLICGDAGYGKTEIAMRAAFAVVMNGKQVAVLAPTTVLAEQHFATFRERMSAFPVCIEVLSRLRSRQYREHILESTAKGSVDILIGTHALLQPGIRFHDLGLVIIDEEQRFGVEHKERLKQLRASVDILTLSATPIPRTLYMSMTGARDLSLLQTPPQERLAIETKVERDRDDIIRTAVLREVNREGQVFFLHNRVLTMGMMLKRLSGILPEIRIGVAHGQMPPAQLADTMQRFGNGEYDLLLCTTIVESGLDIPRANTIIIHRADRFGLAELYQLRGRVGRSSKRGYAYLLVPPQGVMDEDARQRIKALQRHGGLSGGLNLALRDLEIRGAGNILGAEQSGHIASVGFGLYCQLLRRTVARLKGEAPPLLVDVSLDFDFITNSPGAITDSSACLSYNYIDDEVVRMNFHRRIAEAVTLDEINSLRTELAERFGALPPEAVRLMKLTRLRILAAMAGFSHIKVRDGIVKFCDRDMQPWIDASGHLPRITGKTTDAKLTAVIRALQDTKSKSAVRK